MMDILKPKHYTTINPHTGKKRKMKVIERRGTSVKLDTGRGGIWFVEKYLQDEILR